MLTACGLNLEEDYVKDNLKSGERAHSVKEGVLYLSHTVFDLPGFLLHTDQIISLPSNKHDTTLVVQVEAIAFEGEDINQTHQGRAGRVGPDTQFTLDDAYPIVGKYAHWLSDAGSVDLQSSEEESDKEG
jgi:hypothetical protein